METRGLYLENSFKPFERILALLSSFVVNLRSTSRRGAGPAPLSSTIFSVP